MKGPFREQGPEILQSDSEGSRLISLQRSEPGEEIRMKPGDNWLVQFGSELGESYNGQFITDVFKPSSIWKTEIPGVIEPQCKYKCNHIETELRNMPFPPRSWILEIGYL